MYIDLFHIYIFIYIQIFIYIISMSIIYLMWVSVYILPLPLLTYTGLVWQDPSSILLRYLGIPTVMVTTPPREQVMEKTNLDGDFSNGGWEKSGNPKEGLQIASTAGEETRRPGGSICRVFVDSISSQSGISRFLHPHVPNRLLSRQEEDDDMDEVTTTSRPTWNRLPPYRLVDTSSLLAPSGTPVRERRQVVHESFSPTNPHENYHRWCFVDKEQEEKVTLQMIQERRRNGGPKVHQQGGEKKGLGDMERVGRNSSKITTNHVTQQHTSTDHDHRPSTGTQINSESYEDYKYLMVTKERVDGYRLIAVLPKFHQWLILPPWAVCKDLHQPRGLLLHHPLTFAQDCVQDVFWSMCGMVSKWFRPNTSSSSSSTTHIGKPREELKPPRRLTRNWKTDCSWCGGSTSSTRVVPVLQLQVEPFLYVHTTITG